MSEIITNFLKENERNYVLLRNNLSQYKSIFQYVYSNVYPEIYCATETRSFDLKSTFHIVFKTYKDKKKIEQLGKNPQNNENNHAEKWVFEQKPVKTYDFNEDEEKEVKESVEKRKTKRREVAEKKQALEKKKRQEKNKKNEKEMWDRLKELNKEFKDIKEHKKKAKEMSKTIIKA